MAKKIIKKLDSIKLAIKCLGRKFNSEGKTFEEAINKIKIPNGANASSVLTFEQGKIRKTKILNGRQTGGLFGQGSPTRKAIHLKGVRAILGI